MRKMILWAALLGTALAYGTGCDDGGTGTGGTGGEATGGTGGSATGGTGGTGGSATGGTGGSATGGTGGTGGSATGGGGAGGTGGSMGNAVNGCDSATAEDHTADATTTVTSSGLNYSPKCIRIKAGASVTFSSNFGAHPLVGGTVEGATKMPDGASPIEPISSGNTVTYDFPTAGAYGYYCDLHAGQGMVGAVFVE